MPAGKPRKNKQKGETMSEDLKIITCTILYNLEQIAKKTANPIDNAIVQMLQALSNCKKEPT